VFNGFNQAVAADASGYGAPDDADRRRFLQVATLAGLGVAGVGALGATAGTAFAGPAAERRGPGAAAVLNLLLNVGYLLAEFGLRGAYGAGLEAELVGGAGRVGRVSGGRAVEFGSPLHRQYAEEIAADQRAHVRLLRGLLGPAKVGRPALDLDAGFSTAAAAAGLVDRGRRFDAYADEDSFLLGAFLLADLGVTASRGALPLLVAAPHQEAAGGLLAAQAYHAGVVRTMVLARGLELPAGALADARTSLGGRAGLRDGLRPGDGLQGDGLRQVGPDQGVVADSGRVNAAPTDGNGIVAARSPGQVLNVAYQSPRAVTAGGFFPWGVNGELTRSDSTA
jgi:Ferritin-like domain